MHMANQIRSRIPMRGHTRGWLAGVPSWADGAASRIFSRARVAGLALKMTGAVLMADGHDAARRKIVLASRPFGIAAGLLAQPALIGVLRAHGGSKAAMLFAAALMVVVAALLGLFRRPPAGCGPRAGRACPAGAVDDHRPAVEPQASKRPHCYVAMPILPSNSEDKLGESWRDFATLRESQRFAKVIQVSPSCAEIRKVVAGRAVSN